MQERTHANMAVMAAQAVGWPGDLGAIAEAAVHPDRTDILTVDGVGAHLYGHALCSLTHFARAVRGDDGIVHFHGYNWKRDASGPHLDLPNREVRSLPERWSVLTEEMRTREPLNALLRTLKETNSNRNADEMTYPAASSYAEWCEWCATHLPEGVAKDPSLRKTWIGMHTGWALHFVQDPCIPQHAGGYLLAGHSAFEGETGDAWLDVRKALPSVEAILAAHPKMPTTFRGISEYCALKSIQGPRTLDWSHALGRWPALIRKALLLGYAGSVMLLKAAKERYLQGVS